MMAEARKIALEDEDLLWDSELAAKYLGVGRRQFRDYYSKKPDFPKARMNGRRWLRSEVVDWAKNS